MSMNIAKKDLERWAADDSLCGATISETRDLARELLDARQELAALEQCLTEQRERAKKAEARVGEFRTAAARLCWRLNTGEMLMGEQVHDAFMALSALVSDAPAPEPLPKGANMMAPNGPECWCGKPSAHQSGWCGVCAIESAPKPETPEPPREVWVTFTPAFPTGQLWAYRTKASADNNVDNETVAGPYVLARRGGDK